MKKIFQAGLLLLAFMSTASMVYGQKKIKEGYVRFEMDMSDAGDSPELAMLGGTSLDFYFTDKKQKMDMNMMGGLMRIQTIVPLDKPTDGIILMDMIGQKFQIVELSEEDLTKNNNFMNMDQVNKVEYDEKDTKEIAGYPCYKARLTMDNNMKMEYYITEKIQPPVGIKEKGNQVLKGYPLEMHIDSGQGFNLVFVAKEVSGTIDDSVFNVSGDYRKMTMAEFEKEMGGMGLNGLGN